MELLAERSAASAGRGDAPHASGRSGATADPSAALRLFSVSRRRKIVRALLCILFSYVLSVCLRLHIWSLQVLRFSVGDWW
jgi:hypothetical protein